MKIYDNKRYLNIGDELNFESFISILKKNKIHFNFDNEQTIDRLKNVFNELSLMTGVLKLKNLKKTIYDTYGLKERNIFSKKSLIERGFNDDYIDTFLQSFVTTKAKKREEKKPNGKCLYRFGKYQFFSEEIPKCNICGSELKFSYGKDGSYRILSCENKECLSKKRENKHKAFLPIFLEDIIEKENKERSRFCIEYWLKRGFSEEEGKQKISELQSSYGKLLKGKSTKIDKNFIEEKYGKENTDTFFKERSRFCIEYWLKRGFSEEEGKQKISELQSSYAKCILNGKTEKERKEMNAKCIEYWLKRGFSEEEGKQKISELQRTFTKEKCIQKYGEVEGEKKWKERQEKWQRSLHESGFHQFYYSKISQDLFEQIEEKYDKEDKDFLFYGKKNKEYSIKNNKGFYYRFDFCDLKRRKFIEFNGDVYHGNPKIFKPTDKPNPYKPQLTCVELWQEDEEKKCKAIENNFEELIVWEKDYRENPKKVINDCLNFLLND